MACGSRVALFESACMSGLRWSQEQLDSTLKTGGVRGIAGQQRKEVNHGRSCEKSDQTAGDVTPGAAHPEKKRSELEVRLLQQIVVAGVPAPMTEYYFMDNRNWRLDFAWPLMSPPRAVEVQGSSHRIKAKFHADMEKRQALLFSGWKVLEVSGDNIRSGLAIELVKKLLEG